MQQDGFADRDQYNVGGNFYRFTGIGSPQFEDTGTETGDTSLGRGFYGFAIVAIVITMIVFGMHFTDASGAPINFPNTNDRWPTRSSASVVMAQVDNWLTSCADEPLLSPEYCPQSTSSSADNVSNVRWVLHGSPTDGARIAYYNSRFYVLGHEVMTVTYDSDAGSQWQMLIVGYEATVAWNDGHAELISSKAVSPTGGPAVIKQNPNLPWPEVSNAVEEAFRKCAAYSLAPLPPSCPNIGDSGSKVRWRLMNNPLLDARESFDASTGLIHVTGSFVLNESYSIIFFGHQSYTWPGYYNASISLDGTSINVLQIETSR